MKKLVKFLQSAWVISIFLFLLALLPRIVDPDQFLTPDEFLWIDRSRNFLAGLIDPAYQCTSVVEKWGFVAEGLACTLRTGHPGVTTMWTGSFGLWLTWLPNSRYISLQDYLAGVSTNPLDVVLIAPARIGTILITSLWVVAMYWLVRRLFGMWIALVGAVLLALDPFHIGLSRVIHHDALETTFTTLSVLTAFVYWGQDRNKKWLILSGGLAGLAILSKSPGLYLLPFMAVMGLWFWGKEVRSRKYGVGGREKGEGEEDRPAPLTLLMWTVLDGLLWFGVAVAVIFACWPAMWVTPLEAVETVFFIGSKYASGGHAKGNFFLGEISNDPGPLFYPVTWLYRTTPVVMIGVVAAVLLWVGHKWFKRAGEDGSPSTGSTAQDFFTYLPLLLVFIVGYYLLMTLGEKKQERYFLPVYPWLDLIAAVGLVSIINYQLVINNYQLLITNSVSRFTFLLPLIILVVHGYFVINHVPYYFTYYNPWLGGIQGAAKALTIGWGEGLDLAADYLNQQPRPNQRRIASWYESTFAPYYYGPSISYSKEKGKVLAGDYAIFYINQTQRRFPDDILFEYFESRFSPVHIVTLHGLDYAWIYPSLGVDHYIQDQTYTGIASLLAWQWSLGDRPLSAGQQVEFELYWEYLGKQPDESFFFRLVDAQNRTWTEALSQPRDNPPFEQWREGEIIYETGVLELPVGMPPGQYQLQIGFYTKAPAVTTGELLFALSPEESLIIIDHNAPAAALPANVKQTWEEFGDALTLMGTVLPQEPLAPGAKVPLELYWRINKPLPANTELHVGLMDEKGEAKQAWFNLSLAETFNSGETIWQPGDVVHTRWQLDLLPETPPGQYRFELVWPTNISRVLPVGQMQIQE
jgi:hypothetical protein